VCLDVMPESKSVLRERATLLGLDFERLERRKGRVKRRVVFCLGVMFMSDSDSRVVVCSVGIPKSNRVVRGRATLFGLDLERLERWKGKGKRVVVFCLGVISTSSGVVRGRATLLGLDLERLDLIKGNEKRGVGVGVVFCLGGVASKSSGCVLIGRTTLVGLGLDLEPLKRR
jgi:hypothetical protein